MKGLHVCVSVGVTRRECLRVCMSMWMRVCQHVLEFVCLSLCVHDSACVNVSVGVIVDMGIRVCAY